MKATKWLLAGTLALMGCTASAEMRESDAAHDARELAKELEGLTPGAPVNCISASSVHGPTMIGKNTVLYREGGRKVWRNDLVAACPAMGFGNTMIIELHGGQICRNDMFRVLEPGSSIPSGYCRLGKFTPYKK